MIACGWCGQPTAPESVCTSCRRSPLVPYEQRGTVPPAAESREHRLLREATADLGRDATIEQLAEHLGVDPRTVRRWRQMSAP